MNSRKGVTLVELFLVTALMGIVLLALFSAYTAGIRIWRSVRELDVVKNRDSYLSFEKMRRKLTGYVRNFDDIDFEGDSKKVSFPSISGTDIVKLTYTYDKKRKALVEKTTKFSDFLKDKLKEKTVEIFDARGVAFSYLFYDKIEELGIWVTSFESIDGVPEAIKINVTRDNEKFSEYVFLPQ